MQFAACCRIQGHQKGRPKGGGVAAALQGVRGNPGNEQHRLPFSVHTFHKAPVHISFAMTLTGQCGPACPGCRLAASGTLPPFHPSIPASFACSAVRVGERLRIAGCGWCQRCQGNIMKNYLLYTWKRFNPMFHYFGSNGQNMAPAMC